MTFPVDSSRDCARAWEAMPWVLQENAPQEQAEWLAQHLADCPACRAEFEQQRRLRLALALPADVPLDPEAGLERLLARIDNPVPAPSMAARAGLRLTRALAAAVLIQAVGIGALVARLWTDDAPPYRTLSEAAPAVAADAIHVVPDAAMKLADWDALLRALQLQVIAGPNDVGAYTVVPANRAISAQQAVERLRAARGIRFAEPASRTP